MIRVCIPHYCGISQDTQESVKRLSEVMSIQPATAESTYIATGRNSAIVGRDNSYVRPELDPNITHYLHVDSDIGFEPEQVQTLLNHDLPIVSAAYVSRRRNDLDVSGSFALVDGNMGESDPVTTKGLLARDWCGAGMLLVKKEVYENTEFPWFGHEVIEYTDEHGDKHRIETGDDITHAMRTKRAGYETFVDFDTVVRHNLDKVSAYNIGGKKATATRDTRIEHILVGLQQAAQNALAMMDDVRALNT